MTDFTFDRRTFLGGTAAAGALIGLPASAPAQPAPSRGGHARIGHGGGSTSDTLNPATYAAGPVVTAMLAVCNNLMEIDAEGRVQPELAESFEPDGEARVWTARLRSGVTFSDGRPLRAPDVVASYEHHRGEDTTSGAKELLEQITEIRTPDDSTVVFELSAPNADFPYVAADYHLVIMPAGENGTIDWRAGIGTGGYVLDAHEPGVRIELSRRDDYWKEDRAWFDTVLLRTINDPTARQNALVTDEVDIIDNVDKTTIHLLERRPGVHLVEVESAAHYPLPMWCDTAPFDDVNVRLAMKYAIDREAMVRTVLRGHGSVGNDHPIGPAYRFHDSGIEQRTYDPDRARHHLREAGLDNLQVTLATSNSPFPGAVDAATLYREHAAPAGIDITVDRQPEDGYWSNVWLNRPFCQGYWNGRPTADWMFSLVYAAQAPWNETHWENERFNTLLVDARAELDQDRRAEMYGEMQRLVRDDGGAVIPMLANFVDGRNENVAHGTVASNRFLDGWKVVERWWAA